MEDKEKTRVVWVEFFRGKKGVSGLSKELSTEFDMQIIRHGFMLEDNIRQKQPHLLCFEYDFPDQNSLELMQQCKQKHPSLPVLMLTELHSESLAIWAFKSRVLDFIVKPIAPQVLAALIKIIRVRLEETGEERYLAIPPPPVPAEFRQQKKTQKLKSTTVAEGFVREHYQEDVTLAKAARLCQMKEHEFSRAFSREHGIPFREFLMQHRIGRALKLLKNSRASVSTTAYAVGFNDLSNFSRMFRRYVGISPIQYRQQCPHQDETTK